MNSEDAALAARLANGEGLASVLRYVRDKAWREGHVSGLGDFEDSMTAKRGRMSVSPYVE